MLLVAATVFSFIVAAAFPVALSYFIPRAWFVPVMLGLPLFALAFATAVSHYIRFPVLLLAALVFGWLATLAPHFHDARVVPRLPGAPNRQAKFRFSVGAVEATYVRAGAGAKLRETSCDSRPCRRC